MPQPYQKTGYLNSDFKLFHITDQSRRTFTYHYHDFHKILIFLRGNVSYMIEGKQYALEPNDILLVRAGEIHCPVIHDDSVYERLILYVSADFFTAYQTTGTNLFRCFAPDGEPHSSLIRIKNFQDTRLPDLFSDLVRSTHTEEFGAGLFQRIKFLEFLILLNRICEQEGGSYTGASTENRTVQAILHYINDHLGEETLSVDSIAQAAFLNRSYLMHLFKAETGYTIGRYIAEKRLFLARSCIASGMSITDACYHSGFKNYTAFYYAYKNKYGSAPSKETKPYLSDKPSEG